MVGRVGVRLDGLLGGRHGRMELAERLVHVPQEPHLAAHGGDKGGHEEAKAAMGGVVEELDGCGNVAARRHGR